MEPRRTTLLLDLTLLMGTFLIVGTTIFISLDTNDFFIDLTCLLISVLLIIITYFTGIT
ncbi:diguanylate cyclase, partial [Enterococcus faecalis]|nr:diguanylate cyclase [Enterococcus faecalis]